MIGQAIRSRFPDGFWPSTMDASAQYRSIEDFSRAIYPIWRGIEEKDKDAETEMTAAEVSSSRLLFEVKTRHKQDNAIHASGIKPHRSDILQEKMQNIRSKAARAAGVRQTTYED